MCGGMCITCRFVVDDLRVVRIPDVRGVVWRGGQESESSGPLHVARQRPPLPSPFRHYFPFNPIIVVAININIIIIQLSPDGGTGGEERCRESPRRGATGRRQQGAGHAGGWAHELRPRRREEVTRLTGTLGSVLGGMQVAD